MSGEGPAIPAVEVAEDIRPAADSRALVMRGIVWSGFFQVFLVGASLISMLALVRLLSPAQFGQATAAVGILALINCFNCSSFIAQALQLHEGHEPDWGAHWQVGFYIQFSLFLVCNIVATAGWFVASYRPLAPLLHVASIGLLIDCPNQLALTMVRRRLDYPTLRLIQAASTIVMVVTSISLAFFGAGAFALVIGSNVLQGLPQGLYLLFIRKWRPPVRWWMWPDWQRYRASLRFGAVVSGSAVMTAARGSLEALILPPLIGYAGVGLLNRAQVLFSTTIGRVNMLVIDTVYPLLPRSAGVPSQFARHASLFVETMLLMSIPGAVLVGIEGPRLSRLLYGPKWSAADPLIWPGTVLAWAVATTLIFTAVLQARNRLRLAFTSNLIAACACVPALLIALLGYKTFAYAWTLAIGQIITAFIAGSLAHRDLRPMWFARGVLIPTFVAATAAVALCLTQPYSSGFISPSKLCFDSAVFGVTALTVMRVFFSGELREVLLRMPAGVRARKLLRLR